MDEADVCRKIPNERMNSNYCRFSQETSQDATKAAVGQAEPVDDPA
jgi:hypothetical protein